MLAGFGFAWVCGFLFANVGGVVGGLVLSRPSGMWFSGLICRFGLLLIVIAFGVLMLWVCFAGFVWGGAICVSGLNWFLCGFVCRLLVAGLRLAGFGGLRVLWVSWPVAICVVM